MSRHMHTARTLLGQAANHRQEQQLAHLNDCIMESKFIILIVCDHIDSSKRRWSVQPAGVQRFRRSYVKACFLFYFPYCALRQGLAQLQSTPWNAPLPHVGRLCPLYQKYLPRICTLSSKFTLPNDADLHDRRLHWCYRL